MKHSTMHLGFAHHMTTVSPFVKRERVSSHERVKWNGKYADAVMFEYRYFQAYF